MATVKAKLSEGTAAVTQQLTQAVNAAQARKQELAQHYTEEKKVKMTISPFYKPYFGANMPVQVNGIMVYIPVDGKTYDIPETFADVAARRVQRIDALIQKQGIMANFIEESFAGDIQLISEA